MSNSRKPFFKWLAGDGFIWLSLVIIGIILGVGAVAKNEGDKSTWIGAVIMASVIVPFMIIGSFVYWKNNVKEK